jgi:nicotinamidase-related amidase
MINPFDFEGGAALCRNALPVAGRIARLKSALKPAGVQVVYINDNFTQWRSDFRELVAVCGRRGAPGSAIVDLLRPDADDYFVLKPKHSAFFATPLRLLLEQRKITRVILTGIASDSCILATAADAHMNEFTLCVPTDCVAAQTPDRNRRALALMKASLHADTRSARTLLRAL